jgi:hypothetical protein
VIPRRRTCFKNVGELFETLTQSINGRQQLRPRC